MSTLTFDDLHTQAGGLHALLYMLYEASCDLDYASDNAPAVAAANRVNSLIILARDEAERLDSGIGECITSTNKELRSKLSTARVADPHGRPIFEPDRLSMFGLFSLYDALQIISGTIAGLSSQPRFVGKDSSNPLPPAGDMLQKLLEFIHITMEDVYQEALNRAPETQEDQNQKLFFLGCRTLDGFTNPHDAMKELSTNVAKLGRAVTK